MWLLSSSITLAMPGLNVRFQSVAAHRWCLGPRKWSDIPVLMAPTKKEILAASAGWVAVTLNVVPGFGAGYLYQRRWKAYWITSVMATTWFVLGAVLGQDAESAEEIQNQLIGLLGLVALAAGTAVEAGLTAKKSREQM